MSGPARQLFWLSSRPRSALATASSASLAARSFLSQSPGSSRPVVSFQKLVSCPDAKYQIYRTLSDDPFLNLSIEHFLLQHTPPDSYILLLYVNRPSVIIGRNQNPWLETNLYQVDDGRAKRGPSQEDNAPLLIRRRSGGGAVFHDEGNLNFSVIHPRKSFDRNRHAEMVARALQRAGAIHARVNERHDIVLDNFPSEPQKSTVKISGSAYKLTRFRAMHHGTCLVDSPYINRIGRFLRSPAQAFITAKGVESVKSAVGNVSATLNDARFLSVVDQIASFVIREFAETYRIDPNALIGFEQQRDSPEAHFHSGDNWVTGFLPDDYCLKESELEEGLRELNSPSWRLQQTPQFSFSIHPSDEDARPRPDLFPELSPHTRIFFKVKAGDMLDCHISTSSDPETANKQAEACRLLLQGKKFYHIHDWAEVLGDNLHMSAGEIKSLSFWLNRMFGLGP